MILSYKTVLLSENSIYNSCRIRVPSFLDFLSSLQLLTCSAFKIPITTRTISPIFAESKREEGYIFRLNHTGTHPVYHDLSIENAIDYYNMLGGSRKETRLRYLQEYWSSKVRNHPYIVVNTPIESHRACGIANVGIKNIKPSELAKRLIDEYNIFTVAIDYANVKGCRITPNVFTLTKELDVFVNAWNGIFLRTIAH